VTRDGHELIVKALKSNDPKKAEEAILSHLEDTKRTVATYVEGLRRESFMASDIEL
jgi:DNA-binding GntR family transcriptional regulator